MWLVTNSLYFRRELLSHKHFIDFIIKRIGSSKTPTDGPRGNKFLFPAFIDRSKVAVCRIAFCGQAFCSVSKVCFLLSFSNAVGDYSASKFHWQVILVDTENRKLTNNTRSTTQRSAKTLFTYIVITCLVTSVIQLIVKILLRNIGEMVLEKMASHGHSSSWWLLEASSFKSS